jgi:hypothetical protein
MALVLKQSGLMPYGDFDGLDAPTATLKGGELVTFTATAIGTSIDLEAADVEDGYVGTTSKQRAVLTTAMAAGTKPLFLADEGTTGYGTLFGQVVGGQTGQQVINGAVLGPHTAAGSGKVTIYGQQGFYATTLDACDTATDGLVPSNATLAPNAPLTYSVLGLLTPVGSTKGAAGGGATAVARLVEFSSNGSLVNTPVNLVAALNSPSGSVASVSANRFTMATYWFSGAAT